MKTILVLLFWFAESPKVDWRTIFMVAVPLLIGGLVALGVVVAFALKIIRGGEAEWLKMFGRAIETKEFRNAVNEIRSPKDDEFRTFVRDSIREALKDHEKDTTAHPPVRHHLLSEINKLREPRNARP